MNLDRKVAVVTGGTKGVGRGIAHELAQQGARVFLTGRSVPEKASVDERVIGTRCDHWQDGQVEAAQYLDLSNSASLEFIGRAVAALAADPDVLRHTGKVLVAASIAMEYGFTDVDGKSPTPLTLADV